MMASLLPAAIVGWIDQPTLCAIPLIDSALRSLLVATAVWAGMRLLRARNVVAQKAAWGLVLAGGLLMPVLLPLAARLPWLPAKATLVVPAHPFLQSFAAPHRAQSAMPPAENAGSFVAAPPSAPPPAGNLALLSNPAVSPASNALAPDRFPAPAVSDSPSPSAKAAPAQRNPALPHLRLVSVFNTAWLLYLAICAALLLRLFIAFGAAIRLWLCADAVSIASVPHLTRGLHLRCSRILSSPVTIGSGIVLPSDYARWDAEKLRIVLAHERSHVRQGDFYLQMCAGLYAAIFWFSPLGWWLKRKLSDLSEAISDRAGLVEAASHASYAQILLEFAARPRTTQLGVAMARPGRLTHRIDRLLNESSFRQAFAGGRSRMLAGLLLIPAALFAATALIRVQAAGQEPQPPALPAAPVMGQSHPESIPAPPEAAPQSAPKSAPASDPEEPASPVSPPVLSIAPPAPVAPPDVTPALPQVAPVAPVLPPLPAIEPDPMPEAILSGPGKIELRTHALLYSSTDDGDSYAIVHRDGEEQLRHSGDGTKGWREQLDKARAMAHGDFLWFTRNGKSYLLDDQATLAQIESMYKPMEDLGRQQKIFALQQKELAMEQKKLALRQEQAGIPTPDLSKEMAALNAEVAKLQALKGGMMTTEQFAELESKIGQLQGKLGGLQGEIGARLGALGGLQGELGGKMGALGAEQGLLGAEQGRIAAEADRKIKSIIDEALKSGKARPVK